MREYEALTCAQSFLIRRSTGMVARVTGSTRSITNPVIRRLVTAMMPIVPVMSMMLRRMAIEVSLKSILTRSQSLSTRAISLPDGKESKNDWERESMCSKTFPFRSRTISSPSFVVTMTWV